MINLIPIAQADVIASAPNLADAATKILIFLLSVFSVVAIIGVAVSGLMYFFSAGDERRLRTAKRSLMACLTGVAAALGSLIVIKLLGSFFG